MPAQLQSSHTLDNWTLCLQRRASARSQQQQQGTAPKQAAVRRKGSQAKQTVKQTAQAAQRFACNLPWEWLLAALTLAALLGVGILAWRHLPHHVGGLPHRWVQCCSSACCLARACSPVPLSA